MTEEIIEGDPIEFPCPYCGEEYKPADVGNWTDAKGVIHKIRTFNCKNDCLTKMIGGQINTVLKRD